MPETPASNPKLILAVQMLCIGIVLIILGVAVILRSPLGAMAPVFRFWSVASNAAILLAGLAFTAGGVVKYRKVLREREAARLRAADAAAPRG